MLGMIMSIIDSSIVNVAIPHTMGTLGVGVTEILGDDHVTGVVLSDGTVLEADVLVEALGSEIARRWRTAELAKRAITDPEALIDLGAAQDATLAGFMAACDARGRRDLGSFVIEAAAPLLARNLAPTPAQLDPSSTLATRAQARIAAGSLARAVLRWADWDRHHRGVRFIDDDYAVAQLLLERFEAIGSTGTARATHWLTELASLVPTTAGSDTVSPE